MAGQNAPYCSVQNLGRGSILRKIILKVLFVSSGNSPEISDEKGVLPIIKNQGESLRNNGIDVDYFTIKGRGLAGYLKNIPMLRKYIREGNFNIIHAHYSLSGIITSLSTNKPVIVSLMGSDIKASFFYKYVIKFFCDFKWGSVIVKSKRMKNDLRFSGAYVVPNGVDFKKFKFIEKDVAQKKVGFDNNKKHIIFVASMNQSVKNFDLAQKAYKLLDSKNAELNIVSFVDKDIMPHYMNAADVLIMTSFWEGSPNVVKEAMACNLPIVSTDVGDVKEIIKGTQGCYITSYDEVDISKKLEIVLKKNKRTNGRNNVKHLGINNIAKKIIKIYYDTLA